MSTKALIVSTSTIHGSTYLQYILEEVKAFFSVGKNIVFVPYARPSGITHDEYTALAKDKFQSVGLEVTGLHTYDNPAQAIADCDGIFTGGGNTFLLVKQLHEQGLMDPIKAAVTGGTPYMGTSAGANITGLTMRTTNDMPIVYPPSFDTLGLVPFNINPHYLNPDPTSKHKGETRETRIKEFHKFNDQPVVGLREGSWLRLEDGQLTLKGELDARIFRAGQEPFEQKPGDVGYLLG